MQQACNLIETFELAHVNAQVPEIRKGAGLIKISRKGNAEVFELIDVFMDK